MSPGNEIVDLGPEDVRPVTPSEPGVSSEKERAATQPPAEAIPSSNSNIEGLPRATFFGNAYDLTALGALVSGILVLGSCLTCNTATYCLPVLPIALGVVGLVAANQSVDARRTRIWSWIGIAAGVLLILLALAAVVLYVAFVVLLVYLGELE